MRRDRAAPLQARLRRLEIARLQVAGGARRGTRRLHQRTERDAIRTALPRAEGASGLAIDERLALGEGRLADPTLDGVDVLVVFLAGRQAFTNLDALIERPGL